MAWGATTGTPAILTTNILSMAINQQWDKKFVDIVRNKCGLLYAITGKQETGSTPGNFGFKNVNKVDGAYIETRMMGEYETPAYLSSVADSLATYTATDYASQNAWVSLQFETARMFLPFSIPAIEIDKIAGSSAKTASFISDTWDRLFRSWEYKINTELNSANAPAMNTIGGWQYAISDAQNTGGVDESSYAGYGGLDRSDSGNANARGTVLRGTGDLTLGKLNTAYLTILKSGGRPDVAVCSDLVYNKVKTLVEAWVHTTYDERWAKFGSDNIQYNGTAFVYDPFTTSGQLGMFDSSSWGLWMNGGGIIKEGLQRRLDLKDGYTLPSYFQGQFLCKNPKVNYKFLGISG